RFLNAGRWSSLSLEIPRLAHTFRAVSVWGALHEENGMAASSSELHESPEVLTEATVDRHRAIVSIMEELEAVDWYDQRVQATGDPELAAILAHNRDEEKEHAAMVL